MAKLCSSYGSSPSFSFLSEEFYGADTLTPIHHNDLGLSNTDLGLINPDPAELFEDINLLNIWPTSSICSDIQKIKADSPTLCGALFENCMITDVKPEIRNMDCMWSASTALLSTSASSSVSDSVTSATAVPLAVITNSGNCGIVDIKKEPVVIVANNNNNNNSKRQQQQKQAECNDVDDASNNQFANICIKREIKEEPFDDYEQKLQQHSIPTNSKQQQTITTTTTAATTEQHIPAGASLLRKSQLQQQLQLQQQQRNKQINKQQQQQQQQQQTIQIPKMYAGEFVRERDQLLTVTAASNNKFNSNNNNNNVRNKLNCKNNSSNNNSGYLRPDTPHSLDDDVTHKNNNNQHAVETGEFFKHNIDLRACVMGSNNISLTADPTNFIHHVSQELQDTSKTQIDMRYVAAGCSTLAEVAEVLEGMNGDCSGGGGGGDVTTASSSGVDCDSDSGEDEEWHAADSTRCSMDSMLNAAHETNLRTASPVPSQDSLMSSNGSTNGHHTGYTTKQPSSYLMHSDHSYTRCKDGMDDLGPSLETPSDSDEEIDVVSIGDKKLPTNPSDKDRRALQTKVAIKFSNARIVKTPHGVRTIPPRRRVSYELPYTPASSSPVKSVANSRYPSPTSTPAHVAQQQQQQYTSRYVQQQQNMLNMLQAANGALENAKTRKRLTLSGGAGVPSIAVESQLAADYALPPYKKQRGKKCIDITNAKTMLVGVNATPTACKRNYSNVSANAIIVEGAADTIEKRNLHNDMERQRRIGLKNLFEALKKQIPSIKDKERAPKVNILREAAKLCEGLTREDRILSEQRAMLKEQTRKYQEKLAQLRAALPDSVLLTKQE